MSGKHIFISYRSTESEDMLEIATGLKGEFSLWVDQLGGIKPGDRWRGKIEQGIKDAAGMICLMSPEYTDSNYCMDEFGRGEKRKIPVFCLKIKEVEMPLGTGELQWMDFTDPEKRAEKLEELKTILRECITTEAPKEFSTGLVAPGRTDEKPSRWQLWAVALIVIAVVFIAALLAWRAYSCPLLNICMLPDYPVEEFVVAVTRLGSQDVENFHPNANADEVSALILSSLEGITQPEYLITPGQIGFIAASTEAEQRQKAFDLVREHHIDILIYGVVAEDEHYYIFSPRLAYSASWAEQEPELFFNTPTIEVLRYANTEKPEVINRRIRVINIFLDGLVHYIRGNYEQAYQRFLEAAAINTESVEASAYIYAANAASRAGAYRSALEALEPVLNADPMNARALYARGNALLNMAVNEVETYDLMADLQNERCLSQLPSTAEKRWLVLLAIRCFEEAQASLSASTSVAQIPLRSQVSIGQAHLFLRSLAGGEYERLEFARQNFTAAVDLYNALDDATGLHYFGGLAYKGRADVEWETQCAGEDTCCVSYQRLVEDYQKSLELLKKGVDRISPYITDTLIQPIEERMTRLSQCSNS